MANVRNGNQFGPDMRRAAQELKRVFKDELPDKVMVTAERLVQQNFENEAYTDGKTTSKWAPRKKDPDSKKARDERRALLVKSGRLRSSVETEHTGDQVHLRAGYEVGGKWNLAEIHNEGLKPVPQRQFMPEAGEDWPALDDEVERFMDNEMDRIFK